MAMNIPLIPQPLLRVILTAPFSSSAGNYVLSISNNLLPVSGMGFSEKYIWGESQILLLMLIKKLLDG
jgi:hypothetical protein